MRPLALPTLVALLPVLAAQEPATELRSPAVGEVRDADGRPWQGAEVVLLSRPLPHDPDCGEVDRVLAQVDERGRFRAAILRGRPYSAWAWGAATAIGRPASAVIENVFVQQPIVLRRERELPLRELALDHVDRWPDTTFRVRVVDQLGNREVHWLDVAGDRTRLPWLVGARADVELFAVRGDTLSPLATTSLTAAASSLRLEAPERLRITCFARATDDAPLVGARIHRRIGEALHLAGTTDAAGMLQIDVGAGAKTGIQTLVEGDDGRMGVFLAVEHLARMPNAEPPAGAQPHDLLCRIDAGHTVYARFVTATGTPLAGAEILHSGMAGNRPSRSSSSSLGWSRSLRTGDDGTVALGGAWRAGQANAHLLLRERDLAGLPAPWRQGLAPLVFAPLATAAGSGRKDDPFVVDLARLCPIELSFTGPGGTPLANVEVVLGSLEEGEVAYWPRRDGRGAIADERGRLRLLVPAGKRLGLAATHGMSLLVRAFGTTPGRPAAGPATATFQLPAPTGIRGRLLGKDGLPAADRRVHASFGTDNAPAQWDFASEPEAKLTAATGNALRVLLPDARSELLRLTGLIGCPVATDADGRFALPLPAVSIPSLLLFQGTRDAQGFFDSRPVAWTGEAIDDLEWTARF